MFCLISDSDSYEVKTKLCTSPGDVKLHTCILLSCITCILLYVYVLMGLMAYCINKLLTYLLTIMIKTFEKNQK